MSKTSPWMMIDYGMLGVVIWPIKEFLEKRGVPLAARAFVYMVGIFVIRNTSPGIAFNAVGIEIWNYSHHSVTLGGTTIPMHIHGQITAFYAPLWFAPRIRARMAPPPCRRCRHAAAHGHWPGGFRPVLTRIARPLAQC